MGARVGSIYTCDQVGTTGARFQYMGSRPGSVASRRCQAETGESGVSENIVTTPEEIGWSAPTGSRFAPAFGRMMKHFLIGTLEGPGGECLYETHSYLVS